MPEHRDHDPLGSERDRRKLDEGIPKEGPPVSKMATTYGSSLVASEEDADKVATEAADEGEAPADGLGRPRPPSESTGQADRGR